MEDLLLSFLFGSIYGLFALVAPIYGFFWLLRKSFKKIPDPAIFAVLAFLILLFTAPSFNRYKFEKDTLEMLKERPYFAVVNTARWGDMTEPLTWIKTPIGFFHIVSPDPITKNTFKSIILRYDEEPIQQIVDVNCSDYSIWISEQASDDVFRYTSKTPEKMRDKEREIYCERDFSVQIESARQATLNENEQR